MSGNLTAVREISGILLKVGEKILSGKSFLKLSIVSWIFASKQVRYWVGVCSVSNMKYIVTDDASLHSYPHHWQYGNDTLNMPSGAEECCELSGNFTLFGELSSWVIIPTVSSGATWTLSLRNFLWTCITQVQSTFATNLAVIKFQIYCCVPNFIQIGWFFVKIWPFDDLRIWRPSAILCFRNVDFMSRDLCHHVTSVAMLFCFPAQNFT